MPQNGSGLISLAFASSFSGMLMCPGIHCRVRESFRSLSSLVLVIFIEIY